MKKVLLLTMLTLLATSPLLAQTFTETNSDGVAINYVVVSADNHTVTVDTGSYAGRVVVPETVTHDAETWTVVSVGVSFQRCAVTYVSLPATVIDLERGAFQYCPQLDTLVFANPEPMGVPVVGGLPKLYYIFYSTQRYKNNLTVMVPCGSLAAYRRTQWGSMRGLTSPCAVRLVAVATDPTAMRIDSLYIGSNYRCYNSNGWYEVGDTAQLRAEAKSIDCHVLGWDVGSLGEAYVDYRVEGPDTVTAYGYHTQYATLAANRISTPMTIRGTLSYIDAVPHYSVNEEGNHTVFATALWMASNEYTAVHRFGANGADFHPGPLRTTDASTSALTVLQYNHVWRITREMIDEHIARVGTEGYEVPEDILTWPGNGDVADGYVDQLAPYYDADSNGRYNAYAGDYPLIRGDEALFAIFNDNTVPQHNESLGQPFGVEVHVMAYAFNEPQDTALWNTVFMHYDIYNRSATAYDSTYLGAWSDFDLGYAWDDYIGCDVARGMYYGYNGDETDGPGSGSFSGVPPAQGCVILGAATIPDDGQDNPAITEVPGTFTPGDTYGNMGINGMNFGDGIADNERMGMTGFMYYNNSTSSINGEPTRASDYYNLLRSYWKDGQHLRYGSDGSTWTWSSGYDAMFMFPGTSDPWHWGTNGEDPNDTLWNEIDWEYSYPGDRRGVASSGPFTFEAGAVQQLDLAYSTGYGNEDVRASIAALGRSTDNVRRQFIHDTTDSGRPFLYRPYSAPHHVGIGQVEASRVRVYPNPTSSVIRITTGTEQGTAELYDLTGRRLIEAQLTGGRATMDLSSLGAGVYVLRVAGEVHRVVKLKAAQ